MDAAGFEILIKNKPNRKSRYIKSPISIFDSLPFLPLLKEGKNGGADGIVIQNNHIPTKKP